MTEKKRHRTGIVEVLIACTRYCHQRHQHKCLCRKRSSEKQERECLKNETSVQQKNIGTAKNIDGAAREKRLLSNGKAAVGAAAFPIIR